MMPSGVDYLRSPEAIRERCGQVFATIEGGRSEHFAFAPTRLVHVAQRVARVIRRQYPSLRVPYHSRWNHFDAGGVARVQAWRDGSAKLDVRQRGRAETELVIVSVLLDAGAGAAWHFREASSGVVLGRSEGLAVASWHFFMQGGLSSERREPWRVDASALQRLSEGALARAFQVSKDNPLVGLEGRVMLLERLGAAVHARPDAFGTTGRLGGLFDTLYDAAIDGALSARTVLGGVLSALERIWPGRVTLHGHNLGDVWHHPAATALDDTTGLVPFHKLSQWLTYSLLEVFERADLRITDVDALTGLAEYRNGGLLIDDGVLEPRYDAVLRDPFTPDHPVVVEWRAATVVLLDRLADMVRSLMGLDPQDFPLAKVLEGGTWAAGREAAHEKRPSGAPPLRIDSDGTVF